MPIYAPKNQQGRNKTQQNSQSVFKASLQLLLDLSLDAIPVFCKRVNLWNLLQFLTRLDPHTLFWAYGVGTLDAFAAQVSDVRSRGTIATKLM